MSEAKFGADELEEAVMDFITHLADDLPSGPESELGSDDPPGLNRRTLSDYKRLAALGKTLVDNSPTPKK